MAIIAQKYGGTSVGTIDRIRNVAKKIKRYVDAGDKLAVVASAMSGVTDGLIKSAKEFGAQPDERELDALLATGEQQSVVLLTMALHELGVKAMSFSGAQAGVVTTGYHTKARIKKITGEKLRKFLDSGYVLVVAGFQGINDEGSMQTLGRGGSDLTAIAIASAIKADLCQIFTDVDGVYTCDPRIVPNARKIKEISYDEMLEMASSGSKVMQSRSVEFAKKYGVVFEVRSSLNDNPGTIVLEEHPNMENVIVRGVSIERSQSRVTITNFPDAPSLFGRIFEALGAADINIDMIVANVSQGGFVRHSFTMHQHELGKAQSALKRLLAEIAPEARIETESGLAKLSVVGIGMKSHAGIAATLFKSLSAANIKVGLISTSEIKIAVTVDEQDIEAAARSVHEAFHLSQVGGK